MIDIFGNDKKMRGCFHRFNIMQNANAIGASLQMPGGFQLPVPGNGYEPMIVVNVEFAEKEKIHIVQCFQDTNYVYAFGHDPMSSIIKVSFVAFLTASAGSANSDAMTKFMSAYKTSRVSANQKMAVLTLAGETLQGFVLGLTSGTADAQFNLQNFTVDLLAVKPYGS